MRKKNILVLIVISLVSIFSVAEAEIYDGVEFPDGAVSFADEVISYQPSDNVGSPYNDPEKALGIPDGGAFSGWVSLGDEGMIILKFTDNYLTTSGNDSPDLWIFEGGSDPELTDIAISTNGTDWIEVGSTTEQIAGIDIDAYLDSGVALGEQYSYVRIIDLLPHQSGGKYEGADIDAVGAISTTLVNFRLSFPLRGYTSQTAPISSVFDHSMASPYAEDSIVTSYTDETGSNVTLPGNCDCYNKEDNQPFTINGNYTGARTCGSSSYLCYDGHPGTDYPFPNGTPVYAAADGIAHIPASFPGVATAQTFNTVEIDHQNGYKTYYLHFSSQNVTEGQQVYKGQTIIGNTGDIGSPGAYHLHFEVQYNGVPVDPYGWQGTDADLYTAATNIYLWDDLQSFSWQMFFPAIMGAPK